MYKPLPDGVTIKESQLQGLGLFATKDFDAEVVLGIVHILDKNFPHGAIRTALGAFYNHLLSPQSWGNGCNRLVRIICYDCAPNKLRYQPYSV